jgi:hypothetical protein
MIGRPDDWKTKAREAAKALASAAQGGREAELLAHSEGRDVNTVRRAIFAVNFYDGLAVKHPDEQRLLSGAPLSVIEIFARWSAFEPAAALAAVRQWGSTPSSVRALSDEMQKNREELGLLSAKSRETTYRGAMIEVAERMVKEFVGGELTRPAINFKDSSDDPAVDFRFLSVTLEQKAESVAVLIVGPYRNRGLYKRKQQEWLWKAFGLAWIHQHVVLLLPESSEVAEYRRRVAAFQRKAYRAASTDGADPSVRIPRVYVASPLDPEEEAMIAGLAM